MTINYHHTRMRSRPDSTMLTAVFHAMTIPFTIRVLNADGAVLTTVAPRIAAFMHDVDHVFSPFRGDSLTSRANRGDWSGLVENPDFYEIYARGIDAKGFTNGHFQHMRHGVYDPVGIVKGWAIERAFNRHLRPLIGSGRAEACVLGGGGDMQMAVAEGSDFVWRVGIENPFERNGSTTTLAGTVAITNGAVATSGFSKRGQHIEHTGAGFSADIVQASVIDEHLSEADVWATTAISAGLSEFRTLVRTEIEREVGTVQALLIDSDGRRHTLGRRGAPWSRKTTTH